jgi:hypothetical protein
MKLLHLNKIRAYNIMSHAISFAFSYFLEKFSSSSMYSRRYVFGRYGSKLNLNKFHFRFEGIYLTLSETNKRETRTMKRKWW